MKRNIIIFNKIRYDLIRYGEIIDFGQDNYYFVGTPKYSQEVPEAVSTACAGFIVHDELTLELFDLLIRTIGKVDALICFSEEDLHLAAAIRTLHGIPGTELKDIIRFRDKLEMKRRCAEQGVPVARFASMRDISGNLADPHFPDLQEAFDLPFVIKPRIGMACSDVHIVHDEDDYRRVMTESRFPTTIGMIESYVDGEMYHVDSYIRNGRLVSAHVSRYVSPPITMMHNISGGVVCDEEDPMVTALLQANAKVIDALQPPDGCTHAEFFVTDTRNILFCEIGARFGGSAIISMLETISGVNYAQKWLLDTLGYPYTPRAATARSCGYLDFPTPHNAQIEHVQQALPLYDWIVAEEIRVQPGDRLDGGKHALNRMASYLVTGSTADEVRQRFNHLANAQLITWGPLT